MNSTDQYFRHSPQPERHNVAAPLVNRPLTVSVAAKNVAVAYLQTSEDGTEIMTNFYLSGHQAGKVATQTVVTEESSHPSFKIPEFAPVAAPAPVEAAPTVAPQQNIEAALSNLDSERSVAELQQIARELAQERRFNDEAAFDVIAGYVDPKRAQEVQNQQFDGIVDETDYKVGV